jgi:HSP20 family protein
MAIAKWAPFSAFTSLEQEMHSLLDRLGARPWLEGFGWKPDTDIYRRGGTLVVEAELPGLDPSRDLKVDVDDGVLQIKGMKPESDGVRETDRYVTERRFGPFQRSVMLPSGVDPEAITAVYRNGVVTVRVPLPEAGTEEEDRRTRIDVAVGELT